MTTTIPVGREQPFECTVCHSRFTRHENLKRHSALHTRSKDDTSFSCRLCRTTFSRRDLRDRHVKRKHPDEDGGRPAKAARRDTVTSMGRAREASSRSKSPVSEPHDVLSQHWESGAYLDLGDGNWGLHAPLELPLPDQDPRHDVLGMGSVGDAFAGEIDAYMSGQSLQAQQSHLHPGLLRDQVDTSDLGILFETSSQKRAQQPDTAMRATISPTPTPTSSPDSAIHNQSLPEGLSPRDLPYIQNDWYPSASQITRGLEVYFADVSHFLPFLHQPTFNSTSVPIYLVLSILSLAYQYGEDPDSNGQSGSGEQLSLRCFHRARVLSASAEEAEDDLPHNLALVQTLLHLEICAMMYICGKTSTHGLKMHSRMISVARSTGLMRPTPPATAMTKDLDSMWREAINAESHKRTVLAAHQIDALWYQFLSVPRLLSHLEIKHELPSPEDCWTAATAADWAHRRLVASHSSPQVPYTEAVRLFLSRSPEVGSIPSFDPYGAINIAQFLLSSAREVSGWSTMTGQISLERFEPLRASLVALAPFICPQQEAPGNSHSATRAATWEMAMIELNIWSPSHTCGIVESNLDAVLRQSTYLSWSGDLPFGADVAASIQPHLDWFLRYLDTATDGKAEAPWLVLYAYKAFLLAWQLVRAGVPGAMEAVRVQDGDAHSAVVWLRDVFSKRRPSRLGGLIVECLDVLDR